MFLFYRFYYIIYFLYNIGITKSKFNLYQPSKNNFYTKKFKSFLFFYATNIIYISFGICKLL
jgi:hypothetical protein